MPTMVNSRRVNCSSVSSSFSSESTIFVPRSFSEYSIPSARHSSAVCGSRPAFRLGRSSVSGSDRNLHARGAPPAVLVSASALFVPSHAATRLSAAILAASVSSKPMVLTRRKSYICCASA